MTDPERILEMRGIDKTFPGVHALRVGRPRRSTGEILGLVGENGAGKSTLIKILAGAYGRDAGEIRIAGEAGRGGEPERDDRARRRGHLPGAVARAAPVGRREHLHGPPADEPVRDRRPAQAAPRTPRSWPSGSGSTSTRERESGRSASRADRWSRSPRRSRATPGSSCSTSPRPSLPMPSSTASSDVMRRLAEKGVAFIYISHRLNEVFRITDRVTVMKDGRVVADRADRRHDARSARPPDGRARPRRRSSASVTRRRPARSRSRSAA